jgi:hypothetical protein
MYLCSFRAALVLLAAAPACPAELELRYAAVERVIANEYFSQEGRLYVRGNKAAKCKFAFLESPRVGSAEGRLQITARFSGRSALDMFGRCVGLGDSFDFTMSATPVVRDGALALTNVSLAVPRDSYYIRRVRRALAASFARDFKIEIRDPARRLIEQSPAPAGSDPPQFSRELTRFEITGVRAEPSGLVLVIDFSLVVK